MVLILDGNSEQVALVSRKKGLFGEREIRFVTAPDFIKCLKQVHPVAGCPAQPYSGSGSNPV